MTPWLIIGQGLAGSCLAWEFHHRKIPFEMEDRGHSGSTRIAAGMINPITGKNFQPSWLIETFLPHAIAFYQHIEAITGKKIWHPLPIIRLAATETEWQKISAKIPDPQVAPFIDHITTPPPGWHAAVILKGGGRLDAATFMGLTAAHFTALGNFQTTEHPTTTTHPNRILCQGADGLLHNQLGPHRCAKGEILTLRAPWDETHIRVGAGGWLIPIGNQTFRIGSTYEWSELNENPTTAARQKLTELAKKLGGSDFEIIAQHAAIRPILRRSQPLIGQTTQGDWIFNALGSKGSLYAPLTAHHLANTLQKNTPIPPELAYHHAPSQPKIGS